jgi:hypothetical protein
MPGATDYTIRRFRRPLVAPPGDGLYLAAGGVCSWAYA